MSSNNQNISQQQSKQQKTVFKNKQIIQANPNKVLGNYVLGKTIGQGTFGKVKIATHTITGEKVAIKILEKDRIVDVADVQRVSREIHILKLIRHPTIIQLYDIIETPKHLFLIMEFVQNGELFQYIVKKKKIPQEQACKFFQQIVGGVQYLHKLNIVHRDLKPQNLLISYDHSLRLVDFGLSNTYRGQQRLKTACGSPCYAAPQMIQGKNKYDPLGVDIWSCGVILYAMLCGCLPFEDNDTSKLYQKILAGQYKIPKHLSEEAKSFLGKILNVNPEKRLNISEMKLHPFWNKAFCQNSNTQGIIVGYHRIPVDKKIIAEAALHGNNADFTRKCLQANRHNAETTTYYLLLKKHIRNGGISEACLGTKHFNPSLIQYNKSVHHSNQVQQHLRHNQLEWSQLPAQKKKVPSFSFNQSNEKKNRTLQVRVRQTLYNPKNRNNAHWSVNSSKTKPNTSTIEPITKQSPAITIKKYQNQYRTLDIAKHQLLNESLKNQQERKNPFNDQIDRKYKQLYGAPLISKSKQPKRSIRNKSDSYERHYPSIQRNKKFDGTRNKFRFNQTIYQKRGSKDKAKKVYVLGDVGFDDDQMKNTNMKNFFQPVKMPYLRKVVFH